MSWLDRHHNASFWLPDWGDLARWFAFCLMVLVFAAPAAWWGRGDPTRQEVLFVSAGTLLGAFGMPLLTTLTGQFVFTWPVVLYLFFQSVITMFARARRAETIGAAWRARLAMLVFALICLGYYVICRSMFLMAGYAFLIGFMPAVPTAYLGAKVSGRGGPLRMYAVTFVSFTIYFWTSAFAYMQCMG